MKIIPEYDYPNSIGYKYICITEDSPYAELNEIVLVYFRNNKQGDRILFIENRNNTYMWKFPQYFFDVDFISLIEFRNNRINQILDE
jgi:hypothetical protein